MFLILGAVTAAFGLFLIPILPDSPATAIFLTKTERAIAIQRTLENKTGILDTGTFNVKQAIEALKDPQAWFLVLYTFCVNLWNGGLTTVSIKPKRNHYLLNQVVPRPPPQRFRLRHLRKPPLAMSPRRR